jgi:hypothetical protein
MCGNCVGIGMEITAAVHRITLPDRHRAPAMCSAGAFGTVLRPFAVLPIASTATPRSATSVKVSASSGVLNNQSTVKSRID